MTPLLHIAIVRQEALVLAFHLCEKQFGFRHLGKLLQVLLPKDVFAFPGFQILWSRNEVFAQRAGGHMIPIELDTTIVTTHPNLLLVSEANAQECLTFCIWEICEQDRCVPTGEDLSPKGVKCMIYLSGMLKSVMLEIGQGCSCIVVTQLCLQSGNAWQFIECARDIRSAQDGGPQSEW